MKAPAKINLLLRVLALRPDGRHDIESVMQAVDFCDEVEVETEARAPYGSLGKITGIAKITCKTEGADLPEGEDNLAVRAARTFLDRYGHNLSNLTVNIRICKHIPLAAGLAGGSADAAAVFLALAAKYASEVSLSELAELGVSLGADVPFQIYACAKANPVLGYAEQGFGTALARGIGERLVSVHPAKKAHVLLVNPGIFVSAAEAYHLFDLQRDLDSAFFPFANATEFSASLEAGKEVVILSSLSNDLMPPVMAVHPEAEDLLKKMTSLCDSHRGRAMMSGSGPTVFGLFYSETDAGLAYEMARNDFPQMFTTLTQTI
ncbi:4-diphosphocytidyl-2-C-methyl-D-erythritol kinase [Clostridia bacterium]|nr:4-diphosphocytidyl-2-C-methyl-D-erythritol kinase [Clostridia bacterium]